MSRGWGLTAFLLSTPIMAWGGMWIAFGAKHTQPLDLCTDQAWYYRDVKGKPDLGVEDRAFLAHFEKICHPERS